MPDRRPSVPKVIETNRRSYWGPQSRYLRWLPRPTSPELEQPLYVLSGGREQYLAVRPLQHPEPHPLHAVPLFGFSEEWLDPHLPLSHGLLARLSLVVGAHPFYVMLVEASAQQAAAVAAGAFRLQRTGVASRSVSPVLGNSFGVGVADVTQLLGLRGRHRGCASRRSGSPSWRRSPGRCGSNPLPA